MLGGNASGEVRMWVCGAQGDNKRETGQVEEILLEMVDLNILTADETPDGKRYMFSSEGFRDLLGSREKVKADLADYREEGDEQ